MFILKVKVKRLNKRKRVPKSLPDASGIVGVVLEGFTFQGEEVSSASDSSDEKWYKDRDDNFYWGGGITVEEVIIPEPEEPDNIILEESPTITPVTKRKIEQVINAFETGSAEGNYATLVKLKDHKDPATNTTIVQVTYGRSQTTEFGHLKALVQDYVDSHGQFAGDLKPYLNRIGKKPGLATDDVFCTALKKAGKNDPIMRDCQDRLFESKYYQPAMSWFLQQGFRHPLSMLVIYDSKIHSGGMLAFLRRRFSTVPPIKGGNEMEWIANYVKVRDEWLASHSNPLLRNTIYRTNCFKEQLSQHNWDLSQSIRANGVMIH
jgi:chitosanase